MFYLKTNEIPIIKHQIDIVAIQEARDSVRDIVQDSAEIVIISRFNKNRDMESIKAYMGDDAPTEEYYLLEDGSTIYQTNKKDIIGKMDHFRRDGGVTVYLSLTKDSLTKFREFPQNLKLISGFIDDPYQHMYEVSIVSSRIHSILPFQGDIDKSIIVASDTVMGLYKAIVMSLNEAKCNKYFKREYIYDYMENNGFVSAQFVGTRDKAPEGYYNFEMPILSDVLNSMNIFSAADLSQCKYIISVSSTCPLKSFHLNFDEPVEFLPSKYKPNMLDAYDIVIKDSVSLAQIRNNTIRFHVKMPTMQNVQLVRSLILTTLLTALLSIFVSNFYYACRRYINRKRLTGKKFGFNVVWKIKKHWIGSISKLGWFVFIVVGILVVLRACDNFIIVKADSISLYNWGMLIILALVVIIYIFYLRKILRSKNHKLSSDITDIEHSDYMQSIIDKLNNDSADTERIFQEHVKDYSECSELSPLKGDNKKE